MNENPSDRELADWLSLFIIPAVSQSELKRPVRLVPSITALPEVKP